MHEKKLDTFVNKIEIIDPIKIDHKKNVGPTFPLFNKTRKAGYNIRVLDVGGGFASATSNKLNFTDSSSHWAFNYLTKRNGNNNIATGSDFIIQISKTVQEYFKEGNLPELIFEPGRCITGPNQFLLLKIHHTKTCQGSANWLITASGLGTVSSPGNNEFHAVLLCDDINRPRIKQSSIIGPSCYTTDIVFNNKVMPIVYPGEVLAIMDSGAYFTALESSFGFPHPAIIEVNGETVKNARKRETFYNMVERDRIYNKDYQD